MSIENKAVEFTVDADPVLAMGQIVEATDVEGIEGWTPWHLEYGDFFATVDGELRQFVKVLYTRRSE